MLRTASILLDTSPAEGVALAALQSAYADACNRLVPAVTEHRCWNRVALHQVAYRMLRDSTPLGSQMVCNAIFSVCKAYRSQKELGRIRLDAPVPVVHFDRASVHFDKRTYTLSGDTVSLNTLDKRITVRMRLGEHQRKLLGGGSPKEAELITRKGKWYFNLVLETDNVEQGASGPVVGIDVGENTLAASSTGKVWGGGELRHRRDNYLALRRRLQSNGSQSAKQKLRQVSGIEQRRVKHINHETSKAIVLDAQTIGAAIITMEDLTHIRKRIKAGRRIRTRLHRWAFRQLQSFVQYKAEALGIEVKYVNPAYTSQTCSECLGLGRRVKHRFECSCGFRAHADLNASRNLARIGRGIPLPRAAVNAPDVGNAISHGLVSQ
jgi:IS605 OrfB family transposase